MVVISTYLFVLFNAIAVHTTHHVYKLIYVGYTHQKIKGRIRRIERKFYNTMVVGLYF